MGSPQLEIQNDASEEGQQKSFPSRSPEPDFEDEKVGDTLRFFGVPVPCLGKQRHNNFFDMNSKAWRHNPSYIALDAAPTRDETLIEHAKVCEESRAKSKVLTRKAAKYAACKTFWRRLEK